MNFAGVSGLVCVSSWSNSIHHHLHTMDAECLLSCESIKIEKKKRFKPS